MVTKSKKVLYCVLCAIMMEWLGTPAYADDGSGANSTQEVKTLTGYTSYYGENSKTQATLPMDLTNIDQNGFFIPKTEFAGVHAGDYLEIGLTPKGMKVNGTDNRAHSAKISIYTVGGSYSPTPGHYLDNGFNQFPALCTFRVELTKKMIDGIMTDGMLGIRGQCMTLNYVKLIDPNVLYQSSETNGTPVSWHESTETADHPLYLPINLLKQAKAGDYLYIDINQDQLDINDQLTSGENINTETATDGSTHYYKGTAFPGLAADNKVVYSGWNDSQLTLEVGKWKEGSTTEVVEKKYLSIYDALSYHSTYVLKQADVDYIQTADWVRLNGQFYYCNKVSLCHMQVNWYPLLCYSNSSTDASKYTTLKSGDKYNTDGTVATQADGEFGIPTSYLFGTVRAGDSIQIQFKDKVTAETKLKAELWGGDGNNPKLSNYATGVKVEKDATFVNVVLSADDVAKINTAAGEDDWNSRNSKYSNLGFKIWDEETYSNGLAIKAVYLIHNVTETANRDVYIDENETMPLYRVVENATVHLKRTFSSKQMTNWYFLKDNSLAHPYIVKNTNRWATLMLPFSMTKEQVKATFGAQTNVALDDNDTDWPEVHDPAYYHIYEDSLAYYTTFKVIDYIPSNLPVFIQPGEVKNPTDGYVIKNVDVTMSYPSLGINDITEGLGWYQKGSERVMGVYAKINLPDSVVFLQQDHWWYYDYAIFNQNVTEEANKKHLQIKGTRAFLAAVPNQSNEDNFNEHYRHKPGTDKNSSFGAKMYCLLIDPDNLIDGEYDMTDDISQPAIRHRRTGAVYTLSGQYVGNSVNQLTKGIYIVNGKKYIVK